MSMEYIRRRYCVPARRGRRVVYTGGSIHKNGTIVGSDGSRLRVRMDDTNKIGTYHPSWEMQYIDDGQLRGMK
jgi:hypothetical protein